MGRCFILLHQNVHEWLPLQNEQRPLWSLHLQMVSVEVQLLTLIIHQFQYQ